MDTCELSAMPWNCVSVYECVSQHYVHTLKTTNSAYFWDFGFSETQHTSMQKFKKKCCMHSGMHNVPHNVCPIPPP